MERENELLICAAEWLAKLQKCQYAGEIYLEPERLELLARRFTRLMVADNALYETALVILAVNCAYHYYDDQGFWVHFSRLLRIENTLSNQKRIGQAIERRLELLGLKREERTGPFRYVGAILEQCGVSKRYIATLAGTVKELKRDVCSWDALITMDQQEFRNRIDSFNCSRYLKNYLQDTAGWKFVMQVCQLLMLYEQGAMTVEDLKELPGYQPDFWDGFIAHFRSGKKTGRHSLFVLRPRLLFIPGERCLALRFPGQEYAEGVRYPAIQGFWKFPVTLLKQAESWAEYYAGSLSTREGQRVEWVLRGWLPDGRPALFDPKYGFLPHGSRLKAGEYYMLVPEQYYPSCRIISELGPVSVPGSINYRACRVLIEPGTIIDGYEAVEDVRTDITLNWIEPEKFRLWCADSAEDVFSGSLPDLAVSDFTPVEEKRVAIFFTAGSISGRIRNRQDLERALTEINRMAPVAGKFYVIPIGRAGRPEISSALSELEFYLLPELEVRFSRQLYAFNEEPEIEIDQKFPGRLCLERCRPASPDEKRWTVPTGIDRVKGILECQGVMVGVCIPVYRARMYFPDGKPVRYILQTELETDMFFLLSGYPGSEARIWMYGTPVSNITVRFDSSGVAQVSSEHLLKMFKNCGYSITEVFLTVGEYTASTGAIVINFFSVIDGICSGTRYQASVHTGQNLIRVLDVCDQICRGLPAEQCYNLRRIPRFHRILDDWIFSIFACAATFDEVEVQVDGHKFDWIREISNEDLRLILDFVMRCRMDRWAGEPPPAGKEALPPVERWRNALERILLSCKTVETIPGLSEWTAEIKRHQTRFRSGIGCLNGGHCLSRAWVCYHRGFFEGALHHLNNLENCSPVVTKLRDFLRVLLLMRLARIEAARQVIESSCSDGRHQTVFSILEDILRVLSGENAGTEVCFQPVILTELPLRAEDRLFLEIAVEILVNWKDVDKNMADTQDWLLLLFLVRICSNPQRKAELAGKLLLLRDRIPSSPDKMEIVEDLLKLQR